MEVHLSLLVRIGQFRSIRHPYLKYRLRPNREFFKAKIVKICNETENISEFRQILLILLAFWASVKLWAERVLHL